MANEDSETITGTLDQILESGTVFRGKDLEAPDAVRVTRIQLRNPNSTTTLFDVYGNVPNKYIGAPVRVFRSYERLPNSIRKFRSQMFVNCDPQTFEGGEEIIDMTIRKY